MYKLAMPLTNFDPVVLVVSREQVESGDVEFSLRFLRSFLA